MKRKPGRPRHDAKAIRAPALAVHLTPAEADVIRAAAANAGAPVSVWARILLLKEARNHAG